MILDPTGLSRRDTLAGSLGALLLSACQPAASNAPAAPPPSPTAQANTVGLAASAFGLLMMRALLADSPQTTLVTSPLSLTADLLMLGQGARGATADLLSQVLRLPQGFSLADAAQGFANIAARMVASADATVAIADGVWADNSAGALPAYLKTLHDQFAAHATTMDLSTPAALADINGFVSQTTQGKIPQLLGAVPSGAKLVLINALYFKGGWQTPFQASQTQAAPFTAANGTASTVQLMQRGGNFAYRETDQFQAVVLPYADPRFQLQLVLPKPGAAGDGWMDGFAGYSEREGQVLLPRLDLTWGADLTAALGQLGLGPALAPPADYSGALTAPLAALKVIQKCLLHVDEQGAEAAAATAITMTGGAAPNPSAPPPFVFRADRPFFAMLTETATNAPLILAYVTAPS